MTSAPVRPRSAATGQLGDRRQHERAEQRSPDGPRAADDRPEQSLDGDGDAQREARIDVRPVLRVERPAERRQEGRHHHPGQLDAKRVEPRGFRCVLVLAHRHQRIAEPGARDPPGDAERAQHHGEDHVVVAELAREEEHLAAQSPGSEARGRATSPPPSSSRRAPGAFRRTRGSRARNTDLGGRNGTKESRR